MTMNIMKKCIKHKSFLLIGFITVGILLFNVSVQSMDELSFLDFLNDLRNKSLIPNKKASAPERITALLSFGMDDADEWFKQHVIKALKIMKHHNPESVSVQKMYDHNGVTGEKLKAIGMIGLSKIFLKYDEKELQNYKDYIQNPSQFMPNAKKNFDIWVANQIYKCFIASSHFVLKHTQEKIYFSEIDEKTLPENWKAQLKNIHIIEADRETVYALCSTSQYNIVKIIAKNCSD